MIPIIPIIRIKEITVIVHVCWVSCHFICNFCQVKQFLISSWFTCIINVTFQFLIILIQHYGDQSRQVIMLWSFFHKTINTAPLTPRLTQSTLQYLKTPNILSQALHFHLCLKLPYRCTFCSFNGELLFSVSAGTHAFNACLDRGSVMQY